MAAPFRIEHSCVVPQPIDAVFDALTNPAHLKRLVCLSPMPTTLGPITLNAEGWHCFRITEQTSFLFGLLRFPVPVDVRQRVEPGVPVEPGGPVAPGHPRLVYESIASNGMVRITKTRTFSSAPPASAPPAGAAPAAPARESTLVREVIEGRCPLLLRPLVEGEARRAHRQHMDRYHTLFAEEG